MQCIRRKQDGLANLTKKGMRFQSEIGKYAPGLASEGQEADSAPRHELW